MSYIGLWNGSNAAWRKPYVAKLKGTWRGTGSPFTMAVSVCEPKVPFIPSLVTCCNCGFSTRNTEAEPLRISCCHCGQVYVAAFGSTQKWIPSDDTDGNGADSIRIVNRETGEDATAEQMAELLGEMHSPFDPEDGRRGHEDVLPGPAVADDDTDGLPPLDDGSRWDGEWVIEGECEYESATRHCIHEYSPGDWCLSSDVGQPDVPDPPTVATMNALLARHYRSRGCYLPDHVRALAEDLCQEASRLDAGKPGANARTLADAIYWAWSDARAAANRVLGTRLLAILDELHGKGVC
jgi:hypothetical protein